MKVGIAGNGTIIPEFIRGAREAGMEICSICGRAKSIDKLNALAEQFHIPSVLTDYDEMLKTDIDFVYVGVSNYMHYEYTEKALKAGKNVICEKPFTSNLAQAEKLYQLAQEKHLYVFEAIMNQYHPSFAALQEAVGKIGTIRIAELSISQYSRRYNAFLAGEVLPVFDPQKAGGALMDINLYNIYLITGLFGEPESISYHANIVRDIDTSGILVMDYKDFRACLTGAKDCDAPARISIHGDQGYIYTFQKAGYITEFRTVLGDGREETFSDNGQHAHMFAEMAAFRRMYEEDAFDEMMEHLKHSLAVMKIMDTARNQAGILTDF